MKSVKKGDITARRWKISVYEFVPSETLKKNHKLYIYPNISVKTLPGIFVWMHYSKLGPVAQIGRMKCLKHTFLERASGF